MPRKSITATTSLGALLLAAPWHPAHAASKPGNITYKGPIVDTRYGPVEAIIKVKSKKIYKVILAAAPDTDRSQFIDEQAAPLLRDEVLKAQSARVDMISGATVTSGAFIQSLGKAVKKARKAHTLR